MKWERMSWRKMRWWTNCVSLLAVFVSLPVGAQRIALKTNALYWATLSPNVSAEFRVSRHVTWDFDLAGNALTLGDTRLKFASLQTEGRYWFSRTMIRHFVGVTALGDSYDLCYNSKNYRGDIFGGGITYGYVWALGKHFNVEATLGAGLVHYRYKQWRNGEAMPDKPNHSGTTFAPVRAGLSISYIIK